MPVKPKGGLYHQKKRPTSNHRQPSIDFTGHPPRIINAPTRISSLMDVRKQFVFASLVGRRVTISTVDGGAISGTFCLYGNGTLLPWGEDEEEAPINTSQYHVFVRQAASSSTHQLQMPTGQTALMDDEDEGWKIVKQKQKRGSVRSSRTDLPLPTPDDATNRSCCSSASSHTVCIPNPAAGSPVMIYPQIEPDTLKQSSVWLRDAYRAPTHNTKSSKIHDYLGIPWEDIKTILAPEVPDEVQMDCDFTSQPAQNKTGFQTDVEIAAAATKWPTSQRALQRWSADEEDGPARREAISWNVEDQQSTTWDQFSVNESKFGVKSTYVDGMYSTKLDEHAIPADYRRKADRIVDEMETSAAIRKKTYKGGYRSDDSGDDNDDEEARFSAVAGTGRYAPSGVAANKCPPYLHSNNRNQQSVGRRSMGHQKPSVVPAPSSVRSHPNNQPSYEIMEIRNDSTVQVAPGNTTVVKRPPAQQSPRSHVHEESPAAETGEIQHQEDHGSASGGTVRILQSTQNNALSSSSSSGADATRSVKDNINALNLEPIRSRIQSQPKHQPVQQATAAVTGVIEPVPISSPANDSQESRRLKKAEFMRSLKQIENNLERKGWATPAAVKVAASKSQEKFEDKPSAGSGSLSTKVPLANSEPVVGDKPQQIEVVDQCKPDTVSGLVGSSCPPVGLISQQPNIGMMHAGQQQLLQHQYQLQQQLQFQKQFYNGLAVDKNTGRPPVAWSQPAQIIGKSAAGDVEMIAPGSADESSYMAKPVFHFNPNASSFTPKGSVSWTVATPPSHNGASVPATGRSPMDQQENGRNSQKRTNIAFRPFNPTVAEYRRLATRRNPQGEFEEAEPRNFFDLFLESAREGASNHDPSQVLPDWENKLTLSYTDLLRQGMGPFMAGPLYGQSQPPHHPAFYAVPAGPAGFNPAAAAAGFPAPQFVNLTPMMATGRMFTTTAATPGMENLEATAGGPATFHPILFQSHHQGAPQRWTTTPSEGQPWLIPAGATSGAPPAQYPPTDMRAYNMVATSSRVPYRMN